MKLLDLCSDVGNSMSGIEFFFINILRAKRNFSGYEDEISAEEKSQYNSSLCFEAMKRKYIRLKIIEKKM